MESKGDVIDYITKISKIYTITGKYSAFNIAIKRFTINLR